MENDATTNPDPANPPAIPPVDTSLKGLCDSLRAELLTIEKAARGIKEHAELQGLQAFAGQHSEMIAQSMLAVRHIEDARMRIGKVLQYGRDGVSIFDRPEPQP
jgi:hypothetical protein